MRIELAGSLIRPEPLVIKFIANQNFNVQQYIDLGYTHFDVICIGAGGGKGGGIDTANSGTLVVNYGGAGGGGGFHRVRGLLSALPSSCPVVVGVAGTAGADRVSNPALATDGGDGGYSSFNNPTCRASGGKGGKRAQSNSLTVSTAANGGDGGIGNRTTAGGGGTGGLAGTPAVSGSGVAGFPGADGTFLYDPLTQYVGKGGGGGAGGVGKYGETPATAHNYATASGRGSWNPGDISVYGPADSPTNDPATSAPQIVPGKAGGAKAAPLNGLPYWFGRSSDPGTVILRLTAEE
jgi:Glycine-rich domain